MASWTSEWKKLLGLAAVFCALFWLPVGGSRFAAAVMEALHLARWYAREHVLLCLVPAFFIAGAIGVFVSQASVMRYLGARAKKVVAYGVASVSGSILAVCSCTVLPLFAGIYRMGAGLGPAAAFLYSGPAINVLAIIMTARVLGWQLGVARAVGAIVFSVLIGLAMQAIYRKEEADKAAAQADLPRPDVARPLWQNAVFFALMIGVLVFANWGAPNDFRFELHDGRSVRAAVLEGPEAGEGAESVYRLKLLEGGNSGTELELRAGEVASRQRVRGTWLSVWRAKWWIASAFAVALGAVLMAWFGVAWWKLALAAVGPVALGMLLPSSGLWVLLPFSAGIASLAVAVGTSRGEGEQWLEATWTFAKQILPLLLAGVLVAGFLLGRPGTEGVIPGKYVALLVGDRPDALLDATGWGGHAAEGVVRSIWPVWTNFFAAVFGAFMYFATLTEVPILQGLIGAGMGRGPALALLLAGPALSLPNMLVIASVLGARKTVTFVSLVVVMATISGLLYGSLF